MRQLLLSLGVMLMIASIGAAAPACVSGSLSSYIALGASGCTVGTITFANFAYSAKSSGGAPQISANQIQLNPSLQIPDTGGFIFSAKWSVTTGQTQESIIKYTVAGTATGSGNLMLKLGTNHVGPVGSASVNETTTGGNLQVYVKCNGVCKSQTSAQAPFTPPATVLAVTDDVKLSGTASLSGFTALFDYCPQCV